MADIFPKSLGRHVKLPRSLMKAARFINRLEAFQIVNIHGRPPLNAQAYTGLMIRVKALRHLCVKHICIEPFKGFCDTRIWQC